MKYYYGSSLSKFGVEQSRKRETSILEIISRGGNLPSKILQVTYSTSSSRLVRYPLLAAFAY